VTETILEKYNILEPVSLRGWTIIWLRRITRSSTCVCLRLRTFYFYFALRYACAEHSTLALRPCPVPPCSIPVLSGFALFFTLRRPDCMLCKWARATLPPTALTYAQPFRRLCWICGAGRTFARAGRASMRALAIADTHNFYPLSH
jgi:hypothetical protein